MWCENLVRTGPCPSVRQAGKSTQTRAAFHAPPPFNITCKDRRSYYIATLQCSTGLSRCPGSSLVPMSFRKHKSSRFFTSRRRSYLGRKADRFNQRISRTIWKWKISEVVFMPTLPFSAIFLLHPSHHGHSARLTRPLQPDRLRPPRKNDDVNRLVPKYSETVRYYHCLSGTDYHQDMSFGIENV